MDNYKKVAILMVGLAIVSIALVILDANYSTSSIREMRCLDPSNSVGKADILIPCTSDSDCSKARMEAFCSPASVNYWKCGFRDFCETGICKHDCSIA